MRIGRELGKDGCQPAPSQGWLQKQYLPAVEGEPKINATGLHVWFDQAACFGLVDFVSTLKTSRNACHIRPNGSRRSNPGLVSLIHF